MPRPHFDVIDGMDVLHGVLHNLPHLLETFEVPEGRDSVSLNHDVALRQEFDGLQSGPFGSNQPLPSSDKPLLVGDERLDLDDVTGHLIV